MKLNSLSKLNQLNRVELINLIRDMEIRHKLELNEIMSRLRTVQDLISRKVNRFLGNRV